VLALILAGCSTVTLRPEGTGKLATEPTHEETLNYYFWGLRGEHRVDVRAICGDRQVEQMQAQDTFGNRVLTVLTLGIYYPRSVRVWCG
jgi:hypothetical protein